MPRAPDQDDSLVSRAIGVVGPASRSLDRPSVDQHAVQCYEEDAFLLEGVTPVVAAGISDRESSIVTATKSTPGRSRSAPRSASRRSRRSSPRER